LITRTLSLILAVVATAAASHVAQAQAPVGAPAARTTAQSQLPTPELVRTVGCDACRGPDLFGRIVGVAGGRDSTFAVLTAEAPFVRVWNLNTERVLQFGREGGGPGEMGRPLGVILGPGAIQVAGASGGRMHIESFDFDGNHIQSTTLDRTEFSLVDFMQGSPSGRWGVIRSRSTPEPRVRRLDVATGAITAVALPPSLLEGVPVSVLNRLVIAVSDDGRVALGHGDIDYRLALVPPGGGAPLIGGRDIAKTERPALTAAQQEAAQQAAVATFQRSNPDASPAELARVSATMVPNGPQPIPHLSATFDGALRFDAAGRLWARTPHGNFSRQTTFDVFDPQLTYLGRVAINGTASYWHIGTDYLITSGQSDAGIPVVRVWAIR